MHQILTYLVGLALLATVAVLITGIINMIRGKQSPQQSNKLMRWRVGAQIVAILLFTLFLLTKHT
ncbi:MAG: twin transmembrane helix small protein [Candidatus Puniceispirillum sp.]|nr:twin transmembrane helix small protein [Candidatus Puniceispirillum sp.]